MAEKERSGHAKKKLRAKFDFYYKVLKSMNDITKLGKLLWIETDPEITDHFERLKKNLAKREKKTLMARKRV